MGDLKRPMGDLIQTKGDLSQTLNDLVRRLGDLQGDLSVTFPGHCATLVLPWNDPFNTIPEGNNIFFFRPQ